MSAYAGGVSTRTPTRKHGAALLLAAALLVPASPATAADATVTVANNAFSPANVTVGLGDTVTWNFPDAVSHTSTSNQGFWDSGAKSGGASFARTFGSAGRYGYHCTFHSSMTGSVRVPVRATGSAAGGWTLRWATAKAPATRDYDVQVRHEGDSSWTWLRRNTAKPTASFDPARTGTWQVRARTSNTDAGKSSGWSPVKAVPVS